MAGARPYASLDAMIRIGEGVWAALTRDDWLEAFAAHPAIGERGPVSVWSAQEQSGMHEAGEDLRAKLSRSNAAYHARFGFTFIVCATGKSPEEMLALLDARIGNAPDAELQIAATEQRKITGLRLAKLVDGHA